MEICRVPRPLLPINLRFDQTSTFRSATLKYHLFPNAKKLGELSIGDDQMFILGMGFVGQFFASDLKNKAWVVSGSCTSVAKKKKLEELGYQAFVFDANDPQQEILEIVKHHTHLVVSIPPLKGLGDPLLRHKGLVESILKDGKLRWLVYLSSTSVYGDCGGAWVDEDYPLQPSSELARARLAAEEEWLCVGRNLGISAQVFRLGGIYGPGRSAVDTILKQEPLSKGQKTRFLKNYTSRVHVADICQALHASILKPSTGKIYNIVDDDPAPREEVFELAQTLVDEKYPGHGKRFISPERSKSLVTEKSPRGEKRVSNARMRNELGVKLFHPTYRSGLQSIIEQMDN
ncbi:protein yeez [Phtheirospermum japonicum]|uniref:Protein yeez n=1 Tax=Phtheirospermum japonicum TaxID=374723 RepID=A0A830D2M0_9LAMI|nr:protein yeez [Phtheirospermum japonicum]